MPARGQSKTKNTTQGVFFFAAAPAKGKGRRSPVGRRHGASPSPAFPRGRSKKNNTLGGVFFFCSGPAERSRRPAERNKKKHFAHPGPTAKNFLETNDAGHEQKGATKKKNTLAPEIVLLALKASDCPEICSPAAPTPVS